jgi:hypothetical protein
MFELEFEPRVRLRVRDDHHHRIVLQPSLLRPGALALITPPGQKAIFLSVEDARAMRSFIDAYIESQEP